MGLYKKFFKRFNQIIFLRKSFNIKIALILFLYDFRNKLKFFEPLIIKIKHKAILCYLTFKYNCFIDSFINKPVDRLSPIDSPSTIWICWWDGLETMPDIVKASYRSIINNGGGVHPVQLITKYNFQDYVSIPDYIIEKLNNGIITRTHFSDILRVALLYEHGGIWMDATILTVSEILFNDISFYTIKSECENKYISRSEFAGLSLKNRKHYQFSTSHYNRWTGFFLAIGTKHHILFDFMMNFFYSYWKEHDTQIDYLLVDYIIAIGYDNIPQIKDLFDNVPFSPQKTHGFLESKLNEEFSCDVFKNYCAGTPFHKITYKKQYDSFTPDGKLTFYGYILQTYIKEQQ
jgi:hypothetical protein